MTRSDAIEYLASRYSDLERQTSTEQADSPLGYKTVLDVALRDLEFAEEDLATAEVESADARAFLALLDYHAVYRFYTILSALGNISIDGITINYAQTIRQLEALLRRLEERLGALGIIAGGNANELGEINLDYLQP